MKQISILFLFVIVLSSCATNEQSTKKEQKQSNGAVPNIIMKFVKIEKLYKCHYFFNASAQAAKNKNQKEKVERISLSLKFKATKLALETGGIKMNKRFAKDSKVSFNKFMDKTMKIKDTSKRNEAFNKFARSCAVTAGVKL